MKHSFLVLLCLLASLPAPAETQPAANLSIYTGECRVWRQGKLDDAEVGQPLFAGDSVLTGKESKAELAFLDGTSVRISENARLLVQQADTLRSLKLLWGKLWAKVAKLSSAHSRFQVETPTAVAGVRGTEFRVEVDPDSATRVAVEEGEVEVVQPRLARMVRLAAMRQAFFRRGREPSEPSQFDPSREARWERWSGRAFVKLLKALNGIMDAMERRLKQQEAVMKAAAKLLERAGGARIADPKEVASLRKRVADDQRQWRLLSLRAERRLRQLLILARRVEVEGDPAALGQQAEAAKSRLEALTERRQEMESRISESLEQLERNTGRTDSTGPGGSGPERMTRLAAAARAAQGRLDALEPRLAAAAERLAGFVRDLFEIKQLYPEHPLLARERFFRLRNDYFAFNAQCQGFEYQEFERDAAAQLGAANESSQIARRTPASDPKYGEITRMREEIEGTAQRYKNAVAGVRKVRMAARGLERQLLEIGGLIKQ